MRGSVVAAAPAQHRPGDEIDADTRSSTRLTAEHAIRFASRLGALADLLGPRSRPEAPLTLLHAGCGDGRVTEALHGFGHDVTGCDGDPGVIEQCREGGGATYVVASAADVTVPWFFDVVCALDEVSLIEDEQEWRRTMINLASLVQLAGLLIVSDVPAVDGMPCRRGLDAWAPLLAEQGLLWRRSRAFGGASRGLHLHVFQRTA